jgi:hypothetical protein
MGIDSASRAHTESAELAAYLDRRLEPAAVARVEGHLAECRLCRDELLEARLLLDSAAAMQEASRRRRTSLVRSWLVAATVVGVAALPLIRRARVTADAPPVRATTSSRATIEVVAPPGYLVDPATVAFTWRPLTGANTYRLTVTDSSGTPLFTATTPDTVVRPPAPGVLVRGVSYLWYVDGLRSDGGSATSGVQSFSTLK